MSTAIIAIILIHRADWKRKFQGVPHPHLMDRQDPIYFKKKKQAFYCLKFFFSRKVNYTQQTLLTSTQTYN